MRGILSFAALLGLPSLLGGCERRAVAPEARCDGIVGVDVTRIVAHLGPAHEALVRLRFADGRARAGEDLSSCLRVETSEGRPVAVSATKRPLTDSHTLLLVDPGRTDEESARARAFVQAFLAARPGRERVAVWRWGAVAAQVAFFSGDRATTLARTGTTLGPFEGSRQDAAAAIGAAAAALGTAGGAAPASSRSLVVVAARRSEALAGAALEGARPHLLAWAGPADAERAAAVPAGLRFPFDTPGGAEAAGGAASAALSAQTSHAFYGVGRCGSAAEPLRIGVVDGPRAPLDLPAVLAENQTGACRPDLAAAGARPFPRQIALELTDEERRRAEMIYARQTVIPDEPEDPREEFPLSVRLTPEHRPAPARAHFRGKGSFRCERRNYAIELDTRVPRFILPEGAERKFYLVSMCRDRMYLRNHTVLSLLAEEHLFFSAYGFVDLRIDGASGGAYLYLENVADGLRRQVPGIRSVIRRFLGEAGTAGEVKWAAGDRGAALAVYDDLVRGADGTVGAAREAALRARLDLDQYLRWLALMTLLRSGDYVDEVFFFSVLTSDREGDRRERFQVAGWDQDDIFSECHLNSFHAFVDPNGLAYCAESELDKLILGDPHTYALFVETLEAILDRVPPARFAALVRRTTDALTERLADPHVLSAMRELWELMPNPPMTFPVARNAIAGEADLLTSAFAEQHRLLRERIGTYRAGGTPRADRNTP